jgi:hypothetical protein
LRLRWRRWRFRFIRRRRRLRRLRLGRDLHLNNGLGDVRHIDWRYFFVNARDYRSGQVDKQRTADSGEDLPAWRRPI